MAGELVERLAIVADLGVVIERAAGGPFAVAGSSPLDPDQDHSRALRRVSPSTALPVGRRSRALPHDTHCVRKIAGSLPARPGRPGEDGAQADALGRPDHAIFGFAAPASATSGLSSLRGRSPTSRAWASGRGSSRSTTRTQPAFEAFAPSAFDAAQNCSVGRRSASAMVRRDEILGGEVGAVALADLQLGAVDAGPRPAAGPGRCGRGGPGSSGGCGRSRARQGRARRR